MPQYVIKYDAHLPKDPPWRDENRNRKRTTEADNPFSAAMGVITDVVFLLGFTGDPNLLAGLFLNLVNPMPTEMRGAVAVGIVQGLGMEIAYGKDGEPEGRIIQKFDTLDMSGERRTPGGIILPGDA